MSFRSLWVVLAAFAFFVCGDAFAQPASQPFTLAQRTHTLPHIRHGKTVWADVDADGDLDVLVAGLSVDPRTGDEPVATLYRNDGVVSDKPTDVILQFTDMEAGLTPLCFASAAWGDYDGDGDPDLAVHGSTTCDHPYQPITTLYRNDGGALVAQPDALLGTHSGGVEWADYDSDGDLDLLVFGQDATDTPATGLYRNDGGALVLDEENPLRPYAFGDAQWLDYDSDGDLDLAMIGATTAGARFSFFVNQDDRLTESASAYGGSGLVPSALFSSLSAGDADSDGDLELIVTGGAFGAGVMNGNTSIRYSNGFVEDDLAPGVFAGHGVWGDVDEDGRADLYVHGATSVRDGRRAALYRTGTGADPDRPLVSYLVGGIFGSAVWTDFDGDGDLDLVATGQASGTTARNGVTFTNIYENVRRRPPTAPGAPATLRAEADARGVLLSWMPGAEALTADWTYNVEVVPTSGGPAVMAAHADDNGRRTITAPGNAGPSGTHALRGLTPGTYRWRVQALTPGLVASAFSPWATFSVSATSTSTEPTEALPLRVDLEAAYPNPSARGEDVTLTLALPDAATVTVRLYDMLGRHVTTLAEGRRPAGWHPLRWDGRAADGRAVGAGLYHAVLDVDGARHVTALTRLQ